MIPIGAFLGASLLSLSLNKINKINKVKIPDAVPIKREDSISEVFVPIHEEEKMNGIPSSPTSPYYVPLYKIVLTGGPCSGKTTGLARVSSFLRERGFRVFTVPEAATILFLNGGSVDDLGTEEGRMGFQTSILELSDII